MLDTQNTNSPLEWEIGQFRFVAEQLSAMIAECGHELRPYESAGLPIFSKLDATTRSEILSDMRAYHEFCVEVQAAGHDLLDTNFSTTWWAMKKFGLHPHEEMFASLRSGDIVEIYDATGKQMYRSFRMFFILSYSIEQLFCHRWWDLFHRDANITRKMFEMFKRLFDGEFPRPISFEIDDHVVEEVFSPARKRAMIRHRFYAPLFDRQKNIKAGVNVFRIVDLNN